VEWRRPAVLPKVGYVFIVFLISSLSVACGFGGKADNSSSGSGGKSVWTTKTSMPTPRTGLAVGVVNGILYAVGGDVETNTGVLDLPTVEAYDPVTDKWTPKAPMPTPRSGLAVGVVSGILYAIGGDNGSTTVEAYDRVKDSWTTKTPMPTARYGLGVGMVNGLIYAVGGVIAPGKPGTVDVYDPEKDMWATTTGLMPTERMLLGVGVVNGILDAVGGSPDGSTNLPTVEAYDPASGWSTETPMPTARGGLAVGVINGILYAVGGQLPDISVGSSVAKTLEAFDPATNKWTAKAPMPTGRTLLAAGVVNGVLYAVGGDDAGTVEAFIP